jgi:hypothetical protein
MTRLRAMIPRIHGIRAAIILASQLQRHGNVESLGGDLDMMLQAQNENSDVKRNKLAQAWNNLSRRSRLQEATVALNTMGIQIARCSTRSSIGFRLELHLHACAVDAEQPRNGT